ncbi:MAG: OB-fold domain-containing protein [Acetobacteraceae bacterium]
MKGTPVPFRVQGSALPLPLCPTLAQTNFMTGPEAEYRAHLEAGQFMIQRSRSSGRFVFYPRILIPGTGEQDLDWVPASGGGTVYAITVNRTRDGSYNLALVDLDEGPRMMTRIEGVETVPIGTRVRARIIQEDGAALVVFDPETRA